MTELTDELEKAVTNLQSIIPLVSIMENFVPNSEPAKVFLEQIQSFNKLMDNLKHKLNK